LPGSRPPLSFISALALLSVLAVTPMAFRAPATTIRDAGSIGRLSYDLAWWTGTGGTDPLSAASALGMDLAPGDIWDSAGPAGVYDLFPFTLAVIPFPADSSVLVLVDSPTPPLLEPGDGTATLVLQRGGSAVLAVPGSRTSSASEAALLVRTQT
jgi:hypothetical protein